MRTTLRILALFIAPIVLAAAQDDAGGRGKNDAAVREVEAGARAEASAAWWGFNTEDVTESLQAALDSKAKKLTIPYMGAPWIVRPFELRGDREIVLEPGVIVLAKRGEFRGGGESLMSANGVDNLTIRGHGAILRMHKRDYQAWPYEKAEWRMGLAIRGCKNVLVEGLRIESSGGDGIYVDGGGGSGRKWSDDITVRGVTCDDNHRQGMSVISVQNLLVEDSTFSNTKGTAPEAGIDLEPDGPDQRLVNCVIRNCLFENNHGNNTLVYVKPMTSESEPISILFENCVSRMGAAGDSADVVASKNLGGWGGMTVGAVKDDGPQGLVEFRNCVAENSGREGARIYDKSARGARVRFVNCSWKGAWTDDPIGFDGPRSPISIILRRPALTSDHGGVEFVNCYLYDDRDRPALVVHEENGGTLGVRDISGTITVRNPSGVYADMGASPRVSSISISPAD